MARKGAAWQGLAGADGNGADGNGEEWLAGNGEEGLCAAGTGRHITKLIGDRDG